MNWVYSQKNGTLRHGDKVIATGYSGAPECKNDGDSQHVHNKGPIPRGLYLIGDPHDSPLRGPHVLPLTPDPANHMFGRDAFLIHGDSVADPGTASEGCIILNRPTRDLLAQSEDKELEVTE